MSLKYHITFYYNITVNVYLMCTEVQTDLNLIQKILLSLSFYCGLLQQGNQIYSLLNLGPLSVLISLSELI